MRVSLDKPTRTSYNTSRNSVRRKIVRQDNELEENLITAWVKLTGELKNTRITQGMIYNEAIVMMIAYNRYRADGEGFVSFKEIVSDTKMLKSLVNRTIDSLVKKRYLERCDGKDKRTTFVRIVPEHMQSFLAVHEKSLSLAHRIAEILGEEDAEAFIRISRKICENSPVL